VAGVLVFLSLTSDVKCLLNFGIMSELWPVNDVSEFIASIFR